VVMRGYGARDLDPPEVAGALRGLLGTGRVAAVGIACTWHPGHGDGVHDGSSGPPRAGGTGRLRNICSIRSVRL
jgi:hypothetical protein